MLIGVVRVAGVVRAVNRRRRLLAVEAQMYMGMRVRDAGEEYRERGRDDRHAS
jgi:hypothetical protein